MYTDEKKKKKKIFLTLDLENDYGTALKKNTYESLQNSDKLITFLEEQNIPLTIFAQTKLLEERIIPECFEKSKIQIEFEPHSYSHLLRHETSIEMEIQRSTELYIEYFGIKPKGFRFPDGNIKEEDFLLLSEYGYEYDSSIFPTWRPGRFNNLISKRYPYITKNGIIEIPFTIFGTFFPIPVSLSYLKLFGILYQKAVLRKNFEVIIFDFHLHDFYPPKSAYSNLSYFYRNIYKRNKQNGFNIFQNFIIESRKKGYIFDTLGNYFNELKFELIKGKKNFE